MPSSDQDLSTSGVKTRLFELLDKLSEDQLLIVLRKIEEMPFKANRKHLRKLCRLNCGLAVQDNADTGVIHDISYSGVFIQTDMPIVIGSEARLEFSIQGLENPINIMGEVVRKSPHGIGLKFKNLNEIQADVIKALVDSH